MNNVNTALIEQELHSKGWRPQKMVQHPDDGISIPIDNTQMNDAGEALLLKLVIAANALGRQGRVVRGTYSVEEGGKIVQRILQCEPIESPDPLLLLARDSFFEPLSERGRAAATLAFEYLGTQRGTADLTRFILELGTAMLEEAEQPAEPDLPPPAMTEIEAVARHNGEAQAATRLQQAGWLVMPPHPSDEQVTAAMDHVRSLIRAEG